MPCGTVVDGLAADDGDARRQRIERSLAEFALDDDFLERLLGQRR